MADNQGYFPIIRTKLRRPRVSRDYVSRVELVERLQIYTHRPATFVSAPAGYDMNSLVSS